MNLRRPTILSHPGPIAEAKVSSTLQDATCAAFFMDNSHVIQKFNPDYSRLIERYSVFSPERAGGMHYFDCFHWLAESRVRMEVFLKDAQNSIQVKATPDFNLKISRNGYISETLWDGQITPVVNRTGEMKGFIIFCEDLTKSFKPPDFCNSCEYQFGVLYKKLFDIESAIHKLANRREIKKERIEREVLNNINSLILPTIHRLKNRPLSSEIKTYLEIIESNISRITDPFASILYSKRFKLTPKEVQVANFIAQGKTTKEIASILNVSTSTVDTHRNKIRDKVGLKNKDENLNAYLSMLKNHEISPQ